MCFFISYFPSLAYCKSFDPSQTEENQNQNIVTFNETFLFCLNKDNLHSTCSGGKFNFCII